MSYSLLALPAFALFAAALLPFRSRKGALRLLYRLAGLALASAILACALFHCCPHAAPSSLAVPLEGLLDRLQENTPALAVVRQFGSVWLALAILLVLGGLPLLASLNSGRRPERPTSRGSRRPVPPPLPPVTPTPADNLAPEQPPLPPGAQPRLRVVRGLKRRAEYPLHEGANILGRADEQSVDIDLADQEPADRVWCSRQQARITLEGNRLSIEDLHSTNGTEVNESRLTPGQRYPLRPGDLILVGTVELQLIV